MSRINKKNQVICFVAGKSGGHIIPCLTLAQQHRAKYPDANILFFSTNTPLDKKILSGSTIITKHIPLPLSRFTISQVYRYPLVALQALYSLVVSFFYLYQHKPTKLISTGGIVSIPVCCAAFVLRIPIELYELNAVPGKTIKLLSPLSQTILVVFLGAQKHFAHYPCTLTPYPVRYAREDKNIRQDAARSMLNLKQNKKTVLILGGSQGSLFLNNMVRQWLEQNPVLHDTIQIIHQIGSHDPINWSEWYKKQSINAMVFSYQQDLAYHYIAADLVVCRAGAGTLFEVQFFNKPCIIIPLSAKTTTHQVDNARAMKNQFPNQFYLFLQDTVKHNPDELFATINQLLVGAGTSKLKNQAHLSK